MREELKEYRERESPEYIYGKGGMSKKAQEALAYLMKNFDESVEYKKKNISSWYKPEKIKID